MAGQVVLERIRLENFLSHRDTVVELGPGVNVFIGDNGAGKTSILEAIYYALTGSGWRSRGVGDLVNRNAASARVELAFRMGDHGYVVRRAIKAAGTVLYEIVDGKKRLVARDRDVDRALEEILGVGRDALGLIVIIRQGGLTQVFAEAAPRRRKESIDALLGLDSYEKAGERLREYTVSVRIESLGVAEALAPTLQRPELVVRRLGSRIEEAYRRLLGQLQDMEEAYRGLLEEKRRLEEMIEREGLREKAARYDELVGRKKWLESRIKSLSEEIERVRAEAVSRRKRLLEEKRRLERLLGEIEELEEKRRQGVPRSLLEEARVLVEERRRLVEKLALLERSVGEAERILGEIRRLEREGVPGEEEARRARRGIEERISGANRELRRLQGELERMRGELEASVKALGDNRAVLEDAARVLEDIDPGIRGVEPHRLPGMARMLLEKLVGEKKRLEERLEEIRRRIAELGAARSDALKKKELIEKAREPRCPLCGQPLTEEHRAMILGRLEETIREAVEEMERLEVEKKRIEERIRELEETVDGIRVLAPSLEKAAGEIGRLEKEIGEKERRIRELEKMIRELEETVERLGEEKKRIEELESKAVRLSALRARFDEESYRENRRMLEEARERLGDVEERLRGIRERLPPGLAGLDAASLLEALEERARRAEEAEKRLEARRAEKEMVEKRIAELEEEIREAEERLGVLENMLEEARRSLAAADAMLREAAEAKRRLEEAEKRLAALEGEIKAAEQRLAELRKRIEEARREVREAALQARKVLVASWLRRNVFSRDGLPERIRRRFVKLLASTMESIVEKFNLEYHDIEVDETYMIRLRSSSYPGKVFTITQLSGGEKVVVSLAAMLALHRIVSRGRIGFLALDEPTQHLDSDRRRELVEVLREFQGGRIIPQLIIVTHDEAVKEAADRVFHVVKRNGYSQVSLLSTIP